MPQGEDRTAADRVRFRWMLQSVNLLYLGCSVLILMDISYLSRFWTQFEAWLSMQCGSSAGLLPAPVAKRRCTIECIHNAKVGFEDRSLLETWAEKTPAQAHAVLAAPDVTVTNVSDKTMQLEKIGTLDSLVSVAFSASSAMELRQRGSHESSSAAHSAAGLAAIGFGIVELREAGYSLGELLDAASTVPEKLSLVASGMAPAQLRTAGASATQLRLAYGPESSGVQPLRLLGCTLTELYEALDSEEARVHEREMALQSEADALRSEGGAMASAAAKNEAALLQIKACWSKGLTSMKAFATPPPLVRTVMSSVCILFGSSPDWMEAKRLLSDSNFFNNLMTYDDARISNRMVKHLTRYIQMAEFDPANVQKVSPAAAALCTFVHAKVAMYHALQEVELQRVLLVTQSESVEASRRCVEAFRAEVMAVPQTKAAASEAMSNDVAPSAAPPEASSPRVGFSLEEIRDAGRANAQALVQSGGWSLAELEAVLVPTGALRLVRTFDVHGHLSPPERATDSASLQTSVSSICVVREEEGRGGSGGRVTHAVGGSSDGAIVVWSAAEDDELLSATTHALVRSWHPPECTGSERPAQQEWHTGQNQLNAVCAVTGVRGIHVASGGNDALLRVWNVHTGECRVVGRHDDWIRCLCELSPGRVASASQDKSVRLWDVLNGACLQTFSAHTDRALCCCALGGEGAPAQLASGAADGTVRLWGADSWMHVRTISLEDGGGQLPIARAVCSIARGARLATSGIVPSQGSIDIFDVGTGVAVARLLGHRSHVQALVALDDDGTRLASGSDDTCVRVWHLPSASCILVLEGHEGGITSLCLIAYSNGSETDEAKLMSAGLDGTARVFAV